MAITAANTQIMAIRSATKKHTEMAITSANTKTTSNGLTSANNINISPIIFKGKPTL